ncbi:MAG: hypothetical protein LBJ59_02875 [Zoogloeaceae bacterium]|nr:hypothetical protein [Zoogloeaceae bacterium]
MPTLPADHAPQSRQNDRETFSWRRTRFALFAIALFFAAFARAEGFKEIRAKAEQNDAEAQNSLGALYKDGLQGVTQDYAKAIQWFHKAAEQGNARAQYNIGLMCEGGQGMTQDYAAAEKWYRKAAEQGHVEAQNNLGVLYKDARGVAQNHEEAYKWLLKAAEQGDAMAQCNLGGMYLRGQGVPQDDITAGMWIYLCAAGLEHDDSPDYFALLAAGNVLKKRLTDQQIEEAMQLAREWEKNIRKNDGADTGAQ